MSKNKNLLYLIITIALVILSAIVFFNKEKGTLSNDSNFAIKNINNINRIVLSTNKTKTVLEKSNKQWKVNKKYLIRPKAIESFLKVLNRIDILSPVSHSKATSAQKLLNTNSVFVEAYKNNRKLSSYYISLPSSNIKKSYITREKGADIFVARIPAYSGNIAILYVLDENYWRNKIVFDYKPQQIKSVLVKIPLKPKSSFEITNYNDGTFSIKALDKTVHISNFDVEKAAQYLTYFHNINFSNIAKISSEKQDSILASDIYYSISLEDINGDTQKIDIYKKFDNNNTNSSNSKYIFNPNIAYACLNNSNEIVEIKYFNIELLMKELEYFLTP